MKTLHALFSNYRLSIAVLALLAGCVIFAPDVSGQDGSSNKQDQPKKGQKKENEQPKKLGEYDEIIIKKKSGDDRDTKVVIEIRDDQVLVNGKPVEDFADSDVSIRIRRPKTFSLSGAASPFRGPGGWAWTNEEKPFLGVATEGSTGGATITEVSENSAAAKAGLRKGDVITKVNDKEIFDHEQLSETIAKFEPGDKVTITYKREGKDNKTTATLGAKPGFGLDGVPRGSMTIPRTGPNAPMPPNGAMPPAITIPPFDGGNWRELFKNYERGGAKPRIGIKVQDTEEGNGVKVMEVDEGSAAEKSGIREDDIITSFDGKPVNSAQELSDAARAARDKSTLKVQLKRKGKTQTLDLKIPKELKTAEL